MISKNKKNLVIQIALIFCMSLAFVPVPIHSAGTISGITYECNNGGKPGECGFDDILAAVQNAINKLTILALGFSVVVIAYAGFLYMTSGANAGQRTKANGMLFKIVIGIVLIIAAWLIVSLIMNSLGVQTPITFH